MVLNAGCGGVVPFMLLLLMVGCLAEVSVRRGMPEPYVLSIRGQDGDSDDGSSGSTLDPNSNGNPAASSQSHSTTSHSFPNPTGMFGDQPVDQGQDEVVQMTVRNLTFSSAGESNSSGMPESVRLSFNYASQLIAINLTRNENIPSNVPVFFNGSTQGSSSKDRSEFQDFAFYFDPNCMSSVLIEKVYDVTIDSAVFLYSGSFYLNGVEFGFEPVTQPLTARRRTSRSVHPSVVNRARRDASPDTQFQSVYHKNRSEADIPVLEMRNERFLSNRFDGTVLPGLQFDVPAVKPAYLVKILAVIDFRIFVKWYNFSKASTVAGKNADAFNSIRFYFGHVFNGVDMRYRGINDSSFAISTSLVGLYVAMKPSDASFVEKNLADGTVDANNALDDFISWLTTNQGLLPQHNQATLFTSESMLGSAGNRISGLAIIMGMCTRYSVAICKEAGEYSTIETAAHEIGHNLGAGHDGVDGNVCNPQDMYIMSAVPGLLDDNNYRNSFHFSSCSISEFRSFLINLSISTSAADRCLLPTNGTTTNVSLNIDLGVQPGQKYTPDDQCVLMLGPGSYYCGGKSEDARICRTMECYSTPFKYCYASYEQRAFDGTSCGNQSWCKLGDCVFDPKAPPKKSECLYGDYKGPYSNGLTCSTIISSAPWNCYDSAYFDDCCAGCPAIRNNSRVGCEYGNHEASCYTMGLFGCYDPAVRTKCCDRCQHYASNISGCEYGDKADWCPSYVRSSSDCYAYSATCCDLCRQYDVGLPDCRFGDRAGWCPAMSRAFCYTTASDCCYTCSKMYDASEVGCEYGDRADWCLGRQGFQCYIDGGICCSTCKQFLTNISGCEYGDRHEMCLGTFHSSDCYAWSPYCCATCSNYFTGITGCDYGDRVNNCSSSDCLNSSRHDDCCFTCGHMNATLPRSTATSSSATLPAITTLSSVTTMMLPSTSTTISTTTTTLPSTTPTTSKLPSTTTTTTLPSTTTLTPTTTTRRLPSTTTTTRLPSTTTATSTTTTAIPSTRTTAALPSTTTSTTTTSTTATTSLSVLLSTSSSTTLKLSSSTFSPTSVNSSSTSLASGSKTDSQPLTTAKRTVICTAEGDKASYCSGMASRDCYVLADTCCQTCRESYVADNGCEYGNRAGWCETYLRDSAGCLRDDNAFWCCRTCSDVYGVKCADSATYCDTIRRWDCYDNLFQSTLCCNKCRQLRAGNYAGCEYGDRASWCRNYPLGFICSTSRSQCCETCQGWQYS